MAYEWPITCLFVCIIRLILATKLFINRLLHGVHFDMGFINEWHMSYHERVSAANEWVIWYVSRVDKPITKCNPCYNMFITYQIHGIVRMYQCVRNANLAYLMITYNLQIGRFGMFFMTQSMACSALCTSGPHIVYVMFAMFSKHSLVDIGSQYERVPGNGWLFIESMWCLLNNLPRVLSHK